MFIIVHADSIHFGVSAFVGPFPTRAAAQQYLELYPQAGFPNEGPNYILPLTPPRGALSGF